ncbi:MAG: hypothetical protein ACOYLB_01030 [Phototrophicaceae bacterium]
MAETSILSNWLHNQLHSYSLFESLKNRRSRRFAWGMSIPEGGLQYTSQITPQPLSEEEEAILAFAAVGMTGHALADLSFGKGQGGSMLATFYGRTASSADSVHAVSIFVINDHGTWFLKRPQDFSYEEASQIIGEVEATDTVEGLVRIYHKMRVKISDERISTPLEPGINFNINKWSLYQAGTTYFLPVNEITGVYINALIEIFSKEMALFVVDERRWFLPAGISKYAKSRGGWLVDDFKSDRVVTIEGLEVSLQEAVAVEQGMILQNLSLMAQALGLGGFANYARSEFAWFNALQFRHVNMSGARYGGASPILGVILEWMGQGREVHVPVGLEHNGQTLLQAYCPPYYSTMTDAVHAWVAYKFGEDGTYRGGMKVSDFSHPTQIEKKISAPSAESIEVACAYAEYIYNRYGRFPSWSAPFRTVIGYQASRVDISFYEQFYNPDALSETQRNYPLNK